MDPWDYLESRRSIYIPAIEAEMRKTVASPSAELESLYGYLQYHLEWVDERFQPIETRAGKRLRPIFCLLACEVCGGDWERALPAAAAVELLHNFSLIHDDIEDNDATRRGRPTVWAVWGIPQALNAGDSLYALAHLALLRLGERDVPPERVVACMQVFVETCLQLTEGQYMDIGFEARSDVTPDEYLRMIAGKTSALLATSCELGALVAGSPPEQQKRLRAYGHHLGLAFQIQDDILGVWGDPGLTGKPLGSDIVRRKKTLPIVHGLERTEELRKLLAQDSISPQDVTVAVQLLTAAGSRDWAEAQARIHTECALEALTPEQDTSSKALRHLALELLGRER